MLFHAPVFWTFFLVVLLLSGFIGRRRTLRHVMLLVASYVFYMAWNEWYV